MTVSEDTLVQGPANLTGPSKYLPLGIKRFTLPVDPHASFHAALNACNTKHGFLSRAGVVCTCRCRSRSHVKHQDILSTSTFPRSIRSIKFNWHLGENITKVEATPVGDSPARKLYAIHDGISHLSNIHFSDSETLQDMQNCKSTLMSFVKAN